MAEFNESTTFARHGVLEIKFCATAVAFAWHVAWLPSITKADTIQELHPCQLRVLPQVGEHSEPRPGLAGAVNNADQKRIHVRGEFLKDHGLVYHACILGGFPSFHHLLLVVLVPKMFAFFQAGNQQLCGLTRAGIGDSKSSILYSQAN